MYHLLSHIQQCHIIFVTLSYCSSTNTIAGYVLQISIYRYIGCCAVLRRVVKQYPVGICFFPLREGIRLQQVKRDSAERQTGRQQKVGYCWCGHRGLLLPRVERMGTNKAIRHTPRGDVCVSVFLHDGSSQRALPCFLVNGTTSVLCHSLSAYGPCETMGFLILFRNSRIIRSPEFIPVLTKAHNLSTFEAMLRQPTLFPLRLVFQAVLFHRLTHQISRHFLFPYACYMHPNPIVLSLVTLTLFGD